MDDLPSIELVLFSLVELHCSDCTAMTSQCIIMWSKKYLRAQKSQHQRLYSSGFKSFYIILIGPSTDEQAKALTTKTKIILFVVFVEITHQ